jgi:hypothetical protein
MTRRTPFSTGRAASVAVDALSGAGCSAAPKAAAIFIIITIAVLLLSRPAKAADLAMLSNGFSIRHDHHLVMGTTTRLYLSTDDSDFIDEPTAEITGYEKDLSLPAPTPAPAPAPTPSSTDSQASGPAAFAKSGSMKSGPGKSAPAPALNDVVNSASATYHLDPDLVNSVIRAESGFNAHAISPKGARGLMQLMPSTANQLGVNDSFDPQANVEGGSRYLRELLERYNFDLVKALAAYNAGPERVEQYQGVPPFRETRAYVARIVHEYNTKKIAQEKAAKQKQVLAKASTQAHLKPKPAVATNAAPSPR